MKYRLFRLRYWRKCQHRAHRWPHRRTCWRRYMLNGTCSYHGRLCYFGHSDAERAEAHYQVIEAIRDGRVPRRRIDVAAEREEWEDGHRS